MSTAAAGIEEDNECILKAYNSLTRTIEPVISHDKTLLKWYICGPTVYSKSKFDSYSFLVLVLYYIH
jgi:hypothetical protein